jgi:SAM-dependent methyltransferase
MTLPSPTVPDALRPGAAEALAAWSARVVAERAQTDRCREVADPADFYSPTAHRFRFDPTVTPDAVGRILESMARPGDTWLDIGAGGGRYSLPIARLTRQVVAVDPSVAMLDTLRSGMSAAGIENVDIIEGRWPPVGWGSDPRIPEPLHADVGLMAHVGYDIEDIGPFLDALEAAVGRMCVAVMGDGAMTTVGRLYWASIHGEARVALPALPDLVTLLMARGRLPEIRLVDREPATADSFEDLLDRARRQLWLRSGSARDQQLVSLLRSDAREADGVWVLPDDRARIGIINWAPGA